MLPIFTVQLLQYLQEGCEEMTDKTEFCMMLGNKAARIMHIVKEQTDAQEAEIQEHNKTSPLTDALLLIASGYLLRDPRGRFVASGFILQHLFHLGASFVLDKVSYAFEICLFVWIYRSSESALDVLMQWVPTVLLLKMDQYRRRSKQKRE